MNGPIRNTADIPLNQQMGSLPNVSGALRDLYQTMTFTVLTKTIVGGEVVEQPNPVTFQGVVQSLSNRQLLLKPEGQRAWTYYTLHADPVLTLQVDDVVVWLGKQTRVTARKDFTLYGYVYYELVQDWTGAGPNYIGVVP